MGTIQHKGGPSAVLSAYTGPQRELTVDTDENTVRVQDGVTPGGHPLAKALHTHGLQHLEQSGATLGDVLTWNGTAWVPQTDTAVDRVIQVRGGTVSAVSSNSQIAFDNSVPQDSDGVEVWSRAVTPLLLDSVFHVTFTLWLEHTHRDAVMTMALFRDGQCVDAKPSIQGLRSHSSTGGTYTVTYSDMIIRSTLDPVTFSARVGADRSGTTYVNRSSSGNRYGGVVSSGVYTVFEVART